MIARGIVSRLKAMRFGSSDAKSWGLAAVPPVFPSVASTCGGEKKRTSRPTAGRPAPRMEEETRALANTSGSWSTRALVRAVAVSRRPWISSERVKTSRKISVA